MNSTRPRLAYLFSRYPVVSHTFCDNEILALEAAGWEVIVASIHPPKNDLRHERLNSSRVPVFHGPPPAVGKALETAARKRGLWPARLVEDHTLRFGPDAAQRCRNILYFATLFSRLGIDHVHVHFANHATHSALMLKHLTGIPFSFTPQAADFLVNISSPALLAELCNQAAFVVAPCSFAREKLHELCPDTAMQVHTIYNGLDPMAYPAASPSHAPLRIVSVGRLVECKGFQHLIPAVGIARDRGCECTLDILGDGPLRPQLENQIRELRLQERVVLRGSVRLEEMKSAFQHADVFALACTTTADGTSDMLPTVITEAMLCGLPVVSTRVAGVPEQVLHQETGLLADPADAKQLADAICQLSQTPGLAQRMGAVGKQRARECFSISNTMADLQAAFGKSPSAHTPEPLAMNAAFFDLHHAESRDRLQHEMNTLLHHRTQILVAGGQLTTRELEGMSLPLERLLWLPDGMTLELEWFNRWKDRAALEELSKRWPGPDFFTAARRALWWAVHLSKTGCVEKFYVPGATESLTVQLCCHLLSSSQTATPQPSIVSRFQPQDKLWLLPVAPAVIRSRRFQFLHNRRLAKALSTA